MFGTKIETLDRDSRRKRASIEAKFEALEALAIAFVAEAPIENDEKSKPDIPRIRVNDSRASARACPRGLLERNCSWFGIYSQWD
jgi:hypothetical protein